MKAILSLIFIITASVTFCFAQVKQDEETIVLADTGACEINSLHFDRISSEVSKNPQRVFVLFRAGKGETETVNERRLKFVKNFLEKVKYWEKLDVVYARGEKTNGEARIEFYVGGKLFLTTLAQKNKTPCLDCCGGGGFMIPQNLAPKKKRKMKIYQK